MINFRKPWDDNQIMISDGGGYDTIWVNVSEVLKAIKEHCPKEWAEAISDDLDDAWRDGQLSVNPD